MCGVGRYCMAYTVSLLTHSLTRRLPVSIAVRVVSAVSDNCPRFPTIAYQLHRFTLLCVSDASPRFLCPMRPVSVSLAHASVVLFSLNTVTSTCTRDPYFVASSTTTLFSSSATSLVTTLVCETFVLFMLHVFEAPLPPVRPLPHVSKSKPSPHVS